MKLEEIRAEYPQAYKAWTNAEIQKLRKGIEDGLTDKELAKLLGRQPSAVKSRRNRLGLRPLDSKSHLSLRLEVTGKWVRVESRGGVEYEFPQAVSEHMKGHYNCAAVYRWIRLHQDGLESDVIYIGETQALCPDRLNGYLNPRKSRTDHRVHAALKELKMDQQVVRLEYFQPEDVSFCGLKVHSVLDDVLLRRVLEGLVIAEHRRTHPELVNR